MIRSKDFKRISLVDQRSMGKEIREWIHEKKRVKGVHRYTDGSYVLISLGERPNPGHQLKMRQVEDLNDKLRIEITEELPDPMGFYPHVIAYPYILGETHRPVEVWLQQKDGNFLLFT